MAPTDDATTSESASAARPQSEEGSAVCADQGSALVHPGKRFSSASDLFNAATAEYMSNGLKRSLLARTSKESFKEDQASAQFGTTKFVYDGKEMPYPKRGKWYCTHGDCPWNVAFSFDRSTSEYIILNNEKATNKYNTNFCIEHNHEPEYEGVDGNIVIKSAKDLGEEDRDLLQHMALGNAKMPSIQDALATKFAGKKRMYDSAFIRRFINNERDRIFGTERHRIPDLMRRGREVQKNGGEWGIDVDDAMRLTGTRYQTPRQKHYARQYGSYFAIVDGTFGTNMYGMTLFPWVSSDCLGLTQLLGMSTGLSENTVDVVAAGELFSLSSNSTDDNVSVLPVFDQSTLYLP